MNITVNGKSYELKTKLGVAVAIEKTFGISLMHIMQKFARDADIDELIKIISLAADVSERDQITKDILDCWDFSDLRLAVNELLLRISFSGTPEEIEQKIDKGGAGEQEKNAIREMLGLPKKPVSIQSN